MEVWKNAVNRQVKSGVVEIIRRLKQQNPGYGVSLNYNIHYPRHFTPGMDTNIPITVPSASGPLHIADAVVTVSEDNELLDVGLNVYSNIETYDPTVEDELIYNESTTDILGKIDRFLSSVNRVLFGKSMHSLLSSDTDTGFDLREDVIPVGNLRTAGRPAMLGNRPGNWNTIRSDNLNAEASRARSIKSNDDREKFIGESLASPTRAPHWYYALGGKQKTDAESKIVELYLRTCKNKNKTVTPTAFFEKLRESMAQKGQLVSYCERDNMRIEGTVTGKCLNKSCSVYSPDCSRFSYRLNTDNY